MNIATSSPLEFEVYHQSEGFNHDLTKTLIGVAYVDLNQLIFVEGKYQIAGYF